MKNRVTIQITYDENLENEETLRNSNSTFQSNERGETIVNLPNEGTVQERAIDVPNDFLRNKRVNTMVNRRPLRPQLRYLRPPSDCSEVRFVYLSRVFSVELNVQYFKYLYK